MDVSAWLLAVPVPLLSAKYAALHRRWHRPPELRPMAARAATVAIAMAAAASGVPAMPLADVPLFRPGLL